MRATSIAALALLVGVLAAPVAQADTVAVSQPWNGASVTTYGGTGVSISPTQSVASTFTPTAGGSLTTVSAWLYSPYSDRAVPITVEVRTANPNGSPTSTVLASTAITVPANPGMVVQQVTATFTGGPTLSAGTVYTLVLRAGSTYQAGWTGSGSGADAWTGNGSSWSLISPTSVPAHLAFTLSVGVASSYSISFVSPTTTQWTAGKTVPVAIQLKDGSGAPMRDADAAALAAAHNVTVEASGAQTLTAQSMKYNRRTDQFTYSLRLARTTSGAVQITVTGTGHTGAGSSALDITVVPR